jgi:hypothetical protein
MAFQDTDDRARTIKEFCVRNPMSHSTYFELRRRKQGPREMRVLGKVLITPQAEADWRRERETAHDDKTIERFRKRGRKAAAARNALAR